jgi:hypothetical protein
MTIDMAAYSSTVSPDSSSDSWSIACFIIRCFRFLLGLLENLVGRPMDLCDRIGRETCVSNCRSNVDVEAVVCQLRGGSGIGEALRLAFIDSAALVRGKRREELRVP